MISSIFNKSKPINFVLVLVFLTFYFIVFNLKDSEEVVTLFKVVTIGIGYLTLVFTIFTIDFIAKRNYLTRQNSYTILLFLLFAVLFPSIFTHWKLILSNLFVILAIRRIISIRSLVDVKRKLFDGSFWVVIASLFYFWSVLFILLVFIAILLYVSDEYRNWLVPVVTVFITSFLIFTILFMTDNLALFDIFMSNKKNFDFSPYIQDKSLTIAISLLLLIFLTSLIVYFRQQRTKTYQIQNSIFLILVSLTIALMIVIVAPNKNGSELVFCVFPLSIIVANYLENLKSTWLKEGILLVFVLLPIYLLNQVWF